MIKLTVPVLLLMAVLGFVSCSATDTGSSTNSSSAAAPTVYIAGDVTTNAANYVAFWRNGSANVITNPNSFYRGFTLSGGLVAIASSNSYGFMLSSNLSWVSNNLASNVSGIAFFNGAAMVLFNQGTVISFLSNNSTNTNSLDAVSATSKGVVTSGTNVYIWGIRGGVPAYWINGNPTVVSSSPTAINSLTVSGTNVYASGYIAGAAYVWTNNGAVLLPVPTGWTGVATGVATIGADLYACGNATDSGGNQSAVYWKNGVMYSLSLLNSSEARGMAVNGNDVYICGRINIGQGFGWTGCFWKNGVITYLSPTVASTPEDIIVQ